MGGTAPSAPTQVSATTSSTTSTASNTGVTTTQIAGIDEGDIVKAMGRHVLVLRHGVLYVTNTDTLEVSDHSRVMAEEADGWIDELLVHSPTRRAVVVGFVTGPDGEGYTLLHLFTVDDAGSLQRGDAIWLRSEDYFSDENYATRLLGDNLLLYSMHELRRNMPFDPEEFEDMDADEVAAIRARSRWDATLPAIRIGRGRFEATWSPRRIYKRDRSRAHLMHAVTRCDLSRSPIPCTTRGVIEGGYAQLFVSPTAAYLWVDNPPLIPEPGWNASDADWDAFEERLQSLQSVAAVYRFPHGQQHVELAMARGQLGSMMHLAEFDGHLHALVAWTDGGAEDDETNDDESDDDEMDDEHAALLRFDLGSFGQRLRYADIRHLPSDVPAVGRWSGRRMVYGAGDSVVVHDATTNETWQAPGETARVDPIEGGVLVTLAGEDMEYISVDLQNAPRALERRRLRGATGAETRTHGFFFLPSGRGAGTFGVPIVRGHGGRGRAAIAFFDMADFQTSLAGTIYAEDTDVPCEQSCIDWYGNARPEFWRDRIFALMGSEIVETQRVEGELVEARRTVLQ